MIQFLADANLDHDIVAGVLRREPQIDFESAAGTIPQGMKDPEVLELAVSLGRVLVTHDVQTMPRHFGEFVAARENLGVILVPSSVSVGQAIEELILIWHTTDAAEWVNRIVRLPI